MNNGKFNLQILHKSKVFETRDAAIAYLNDWYKPNSLDAEPVVVKYGDEKNPNVVLAFGTSDAKPGSFYAIDFASMEERVNKVEEVIGDDSQLKNTIETLKGVVESVGLTIDANKKENQVSYDVDTKDEVIGSAKTIVEALDKLSKYTQKELGDNELKVLDSNSVQLLYKVDPDGGMSLQAKVIVSKDGDTDRLGFNDNIIGTKSDGIYAAAHLDYDDVRNQLIFSTSGYRNGRFVDDAIVQKVDLGHKTKVVADNEGRNVKITIKEDEAANTRTISGSVQLSNNDDNILVDRDGKLFVSGRAKNIKYGDTTVDKKLAEIEKNIDNALDSVNDIKKAALIDGGTTDTSEVVVEKRYDGSSKITSNVRLGRNNSIIVANGGLEANINVDIISKTNTLRVTVGDKVIERQLPGVEVVEKAFYDSKEQTINIYIKGNSVPLVIPVKDLVEDWQVKNDTNSPIVLTKNSEVDTVDTLTAQLRLKSTDNLIDVQDGQLVVSKSAIDSVITNEKTRAVAKEAELDEKVTTLRNDVLGKEEVLKASINEVKGALNDEVVRSKDVEKELSGKVDANTKNVTDALDTVNTMQTTVGELANAVTKSEKAVDALTDDVKANKASLQNKIESVTIEQNGDLQYFLNVDGVKVGTINIPEDQFFKGATFNKDTKTLTFTFVTRDNGTETLDISLKELVSVYGAGNGLTLTDNIFSVKINEDSEAYLTLTEEGLKISGIDDKFATKADVTSLVSRIGMNETAINTLKGNESTAGSVAYAMKDTKTYTDDKVNGVINQLADKANTKDVYSKEEIDAKKYLTTHQDLTPIQGSINDLSAKLTEVRSELNGDKFVCGESDSIVLTKAAQASNGVHVLTGDVKLKTLDGTTSHNIIKKDANGLYATVSFDYDKATNTISFNDGSGVNKFELSDKGVLQEAFYDSASKSIVMVTKNSDGGTSRLVVPVTDLVNTWEVKNSSDSPITLEKNNGSNGDVLSVNVSILNDANNLLVNNNGSLFVDGDSNKHKALFGATEMSVQGAINALKERTDDIANIKASLENLKDGSAKESAIVEALKTKVGELETKVNADSEKINNLEKSVNELKSKDNSGFETRITAIEAKLEQLIDFGTYDFIPEIPMQ